jgi:hypothetical protein
MSVKVLCKCLQRNGKDEVEAEFSLNGNWVTRNGERRYLDMTKLAKLSRKEKIEAADKEFAKIDNGYGPHGLSFVELVALARVSDPSLRDRILVGLRSRVAATPAESKEVEGLASMFGLGSIQVLV